MKAFANLPSLYPLSFLPNPPFFYVPSILSLSLPFLLDPHLLSLLSLLSPSYTLSPLLFSFSSLLSFPPSSPLSFPPFSPPLVSFLLSSSPLLSPLLPPLLPPLLLISPPCSTPLLSSLLYSLLSSLSLLPPLLLSSTPSSPHTYTCKQMKERFIFDSNTAITEGQTNYIFNLRGCIISNFVPNDTAQFLLILSDGTVLYKNANSLDSTSTGPNYLYFYGASTKCYKPVGSVTYLLPNCSHELLHDT